MEGSSESDNKNTEENAQDETSESESEKNKTRGPITTTTKNALITTQPNPCDTYPHRVKVSIIGAGKIGVACAIAILMRRMASEVCLIDKNAVRAEAEAEDIRHAGIFLGNPLITGTTDMTMVKESTVVIIALGEPGPGESPNIKENFEIFKRVIPAIAKFACRAVFVVTTRPIEVMSYITWRLSKLPSNRVIGTGTLVDTMRFQCHLGQRLGVANTSISCMSIGAQGDSSVPVWSSAHVVGLKLREINPKMGEVNDPERWYEVTSLVSEMESKLASEKGEKGPSCWCLALSTVEIVDAILRNTKVVLPVATHILSCSHGTDKDVYMSMPCILGTGGMLQLMRHKLTEEEKTKVQACADGIRNVLRECGILMEPRDNDDNDDDNDIQLP
ncbi:L-lactate dehydrogenase-like [Microplitis demolitor]|uniref:L-lactate dehydrogenase-like n=1 Tax=Microplitis demolitor TaxID=69319 RepID=UPI0004CD58E9|nr:L-lactate dehydrogenase-like [Microplitis demolitor]